MRISEGWLEGVVCCPSEHCNERPAGCDVSLLVIHNISLPPGQFGSGCVQRFFCNQLDAGQHPYFETIADLQVSSHLFIERDGAITQFVSFDDRAWHAGQSQFSGRDNCNDYSIGIELEGTDTAPYSDAQYEQLTAVTECLKRHYRMITDERITGHEDIAPGRKTDPGPAFDWTRYRASLVTGDGCPEE